MYSVGLKCKKCISESSKYFADKKKKEIEALINTVNPKICKFCHYKEIPQAIDFHHIEKEAKTFNISIGIQNKYLKEVIEKELEKCIPLCLNCHRKETFKEKTFEQHACGQKCKLCEAAKARIRRISCKEKLVNIMGKNCHHCKKEFIYCQYDFHHVQPHQKISDIGRLISALNYFQIAEEASKCVLLCGNCHRGVTFGFIDLKDIELIESETILKAIAPYKKSRDPKLMFCQCGNKKSLRAKTCLACYKPKNKINWPKFEELNNRIKESGYSKLAREISEEQKIKISDNAIRKRMNKYNMERCQSQV